MIPQNSWEEGDVLNHVCDSELLTTDVSMFSRVNDTNTTGRMLEMISPLIQVQN